MMNNPAPHGFELSPADERLLRGPPPGAALRWAAAAAGPGAIIRRVEALAGGTSSAVHAVDVELAGGPTARLVLRRFVRADWLAAEPDLAAREAAALTIAAGSSVPTPSLVAVDPDGDGAGDPAVLMTRLPGVVDWNPTEVETYLRGLAEALPPIHEAVVGDGPRPPDYAPYAVAMHRAPSWAAQPDAWLRAIEVLEGPLPTGEKSFIHRDYHPGNVLWHGGAVSGVVDWVNASVGSPWADVGHCRCNLASEVGPAAADRFLECYRVAAGRHDDYHPYWDIVAVIGGLDESADAAPDPRDEAFLVAAVRRL
jgi:aminoglycoside phosphotransferase (APT) family kinase protein